VRPGAYTVSGRLARVPSVVNCPVGVTDIEAHELLAGDFVVHELCRDVLHRGARIPQAAVEFVGRVDRRSASDGVEVLSCLHRQLGHMCAP
jgi:hypothetical protein